AELDVGRPERAEQLGEALGRRAARLLRLLADDAELRGEGHPQEHLAEPMARDDRGDLSEARDVADGDAEDRLGLTVGHEVRERTSTRDGARGIGLDGYARVGRWLRTSQ